MTALFLMGGGALLALIMLAGIAYWLYQGHKRRHLYGGTGR